MKKLGRSRSAMKKGVLVTQERCHSVERFMRSLKEESLARLILFGEQSLRQAVSHFVAHYHAERNHQGLGNRILVPGAEVGHSAGVVLCQQRLGGLLRYYYRSAA